MPMTANGLAKLLEELGELSQVAAKRLAYFHTSTHPDGAGDLNERMRDEMGDVLGAIAFVGEQFGITPADVQQRAARKLKLFRQWHADPDNGRDCFHASLSPQAESGPDQKGGE
jgi:NTP pyrophosphatase (non-canonical NTP hydrolase)